MVVNKVSRCFQKYSFRKYFQTERGILSIIRTDGDNTDRSGKKGGGTVQERWSEVLIYRAATVG